MFDVNGQSETDLFHPAVRKINERRKLKMIFDRNLSAWSTCQGVICQNDTRHRELAIYCTVTNFVIETCKDLTKSRKTTIKIHH